MKYLTYFLFVFVAIGRAQDPVRFREEVSAIEKKYDTLWDHSPQTIVFTGSSSIRIWEDLPEMFPGSHIINTGFGGSQASDLMAYAEDLILKFNPSKVFIYEGDNDLFDGKKPGRIMRDTEAIIEKIKNRDPSVRIVLISAKPSLSRWKLKHKYKRLNRKFRRLSHQDNAVDFANIWDTMLLHGQVRPDIFLDDGLHMNSKGYDLWYPVIKKYID